MRSKILIAEEDSRRARWLQASLEAAGFQVILATDSSSAWSIIQKQDLAMAVVDTELPGLRQSNLLLRVRADPVLAKLPVLMLGDGTSDEQVLRWLNMGADDYLSRSISSRLLQAQVHAKLR